MNAALTLVNDTILIDEATKSDAAELVKEAADNEMDRFVVVIDGQPHDVAPSLSELLIRVLQQAAHGGAVTVKTMPTELTTTVAADLLGVSRPTLIKMISNGEITAHEVGSHKRLITRDVLALRQRRLSSQRAAFDSLRKANI